MDQANCPICHSSPLMPPHEVCCACFNKLKALWVHPREFWEAYCHGDEHNINFYINGDIESWENFISPNLTAIDIAIVIIDFAGECAMDSGAKNATAWHLKRLDFVSDCIDLLDDALFLPASREQVNTCKK